MPTPKGYQRIPRPPVPAGHAYCTSCRKAKPAEAFGKNKNTPTGLARWCRDCLIPYTREYHKKRHYSAYLMRRKRHGDDLRHIPIGQRPFAILSGRWAEDGQDEAVA